MRSFDLYRNAHTMSLNGMWRFKKDDYDVGKKECWYDGKLKNTINMSVPSCWNNSLGLFDYEGVVWYQKDFLYCGSGRAMINFQGVANYAEVYLDGRYLGNHYGAFTGFTFSESGLSVGIHTLTLRVDNTHNSIDSIPLSVVDWYHYGGIIRDVEIIELPEKYIESFYVSYKLDGDLNHATIKFRVKSIGKNSYTILLNDKILGTKQLEDGFNEFELRAENIRLWDTESPILYLLTLKSDSFEATERIGFRKLDIRSKRIYLNNREIFLKGVNRHDEHPDWGFAVPEKIALKDIEIIKDMGCNMVRGSHYPNSQTFLDLCDEYGILFWSEIPLWQFHRENLDNDTVIERSLNMLEEMITQYYNHPSVIIWGMHNECDTDTPEGYFFTDKLYRRLKQLDSSRFISYATDRIENDLCLKYCDLICINKYIGWYEGNVDNWNDFLKAVWKKLTDEELFDVPVLISEFGAASIYGECSFEATKWTENYQSDYLKKSIEIFLKHDFIQGVFVWQFADIRVCPQKILDRARGFNNKGLLNEYRKPKLSFYKIKDIFNNIQQKRK